MKEPGERSPQPPEARGSRGRAPSVGDFYNFLMKTTRFRHI